MTAFNEAIPFINAALAGAQVNIETVRLLHSKGILGDADIKHLSAPLLEARDNAEVGSAVRELYGSWLRKVWLPAP